MSLDLGALQGGKLRALAVGSRTRIRVLPDVKTTQELGWPDIEADNWYGIIAPAKLPADIAAKISDDPQYAKAGGLLTRGGCFAVASPAVIGGVTALGPEQPTATRAASNDVRRMVRMKYKYPRRA